MATPQHAPEWPDKLVFSALLLIVGGCLGLLFGLLTATGATIGGTIPDWLTAIPAWMVSLLSAITVLMGVLGFRYQAAKFCWMGIAAALGSVGFFGLVPVIAIIAAVMLVMSYVEGEETIHDDETMSASAWPDKAIIASLFLSVGGIMALAQAGTNFAGWFDGVVFPENSWIWGIISAVAGLIQIVAARFIFKQKKPWTGLVGGVMGIVALAFYIIGPVLALLALLFMGLARSEQEFA